MSKVVICVEGGVVQNVFSDNDTIAVILLDFDTEGGDGYETAEDGTNVYVGKFSVEPLENMYKNLLPLIEE